MLSPANAFNLDKFKNLSFGNHTIPSFDDPEKKKKNVENIERKWKNASNQHLLLFQKCFSSNKETKIINRIHSKCFQLGGV